MKKYICILFLLIVVGKLQSQISHQIDSLIQLSKFQKDTNRIITLKQIGMLYSNAGTPDSARFYDLAALNEARVKGSKKLICSILLDLGLCESRLANYDIALKYLYEIIKMEKEKDCGVFASKAKPYIGYIYIWQQKEKEALRFFLEAEIELTKWKDTSGLIAVYTNLPVCLALSGDTVKALQVFKKGIALLNEYAANYNSAKKKEYVVGQKLAFTYNMANFLSKDADLRAVLAELEGIRDQVEKGTNKYHLFNLYAILSDLNFRLKIFQSSLNYGEKAVELNNAEGNYSELLDLHWIVAKSAAATKQFAKAYDHLILHKKYNDSVFKFAKLEAINEVEAKYQVAKKEEKINVLNQEKRTQKTIVWLTVTGLLIAIGFLVFVLRSKRLQKKLLIKEKEIQKRELEQKMSELEQTALRAQMNPHFIFNCLNSVNRFIINNDAEGANFYLTTFANLIRQTLENSGKQLISFKDEIKYLETYIKMEQLRSNNKFEYNINISPDIDQSDIFIPNMIIQPYIENSILHGMVNTDGRKGKLNLEISKNHKIRFMIEDNGPGITVKNIAQQSEKGHQSMGSAITEKRIAMFNSINEDKIELEIENKSGVDDQETGTRVIFKFPLNN